jgi:hypothetical protein
MERDGVRLMLPRETSLSLVALLLLGGLTACGAARPEPEIASAAPQGGYAQSYPQLLTASATGFSTAQTEVRANIRELSGYTAQLKNPSWAHVRLILKGADAAGRSSVYVEQIRRTDGAYAFLSAEKEEIVNKVSGAAQSVARKRGCDVDLAGVVGQSFKEAVDKQLEEELRGANEGHLLLSRYRSSLGEENAAALQKQVDTVSRISYLVHVALVEEKLRIKRMLAEADEVRRAGAQFIQAERDFQAEARTTAAEKEASEERIAEMNKSRALLDSAILQGEELLPKLEEQLLSIQKEYDDAFTALVAKIDAKAKAEVP